MTRASALFVSLLVTVPVFAGQIAPSSNIVGGLRRSPFLGTALKGETAATIDVVVPGSTAEAIGLQPGDTFVSVDGKPVAGPASVVAAIASKRAGDPVTVVVRRGTETITKEGTIKPRPLEQQADYDIDYGNVDVDGARRRVIVTRPRTSGRHPAVMLVGGIGCYSFDGLLSPAELTQSYAKVIDAFTRAGYVTMRVEKSGMGDSEGPRCNDPRADFETEARGYAAGLAQLETRDDVDRRNIFLFAHSIGPLLAARVASEHPVQGFILLETVGTSWMEYDLNNGRRQFLLTGTSYDQIDAKMRHHEVCVHRYYVDRQKPEDIVATDPGCAEDLALPAPYTYMQQVGNLDLGPLWKKIDAPVLIFYGTADFVTDDYQAQSLRDMINALHPGRATYIRVEGMDHGLTLVGTQKASLEGKEGPFAQQVVDESLKFLARNRAT